jgi:hypothetical protein
LALEKIVVEEHNKMLEKEQPNEKLPKLNCVNI